MNNNSFSELFLSETKEICSLINYNDIENIARIVHEIREKKGRLFFIGSGGGAGNASHAVCDFRKICNIEAYAPYDNISELTARVNDEGWDTTIINWLITSNAGANDGIFVFSVGGGNAEKNLSNNIVLAVKYMKENGGKVVGIVGKDSGFTKQSGDAVLLIPTVNSERITVHTEGFQAIIWHLLVSHPLLQVNKTKWESVK